MLTACSDDVQGTVLNNALVCEKPGRVADPATCTEFRREITVRTDHGDTRILKFEPTAFVEVRPGTQWPSREN